MSLCVSTMLSYQKDSVTILDLSSLVLVLHITEVADRVEGQEGGFPNFYTAKIMAGTRSRTSGNTLCFIFLASILSCMRVQGFVFPPSRPTSSLGVSSWTGRSSWGVPSSRIPLPALHGAKTTSGSKSKKASPSAAGETTGSGTRSKHDKSISAKNTEILPASKAALDGDTEVFCNREINMQQIRAIGFDMDYTLAQYNLAFELLAYDGAKAKLVEKLGYPVRFQHEGILYKT